MATPSLYVQLAQGRTVRMPDRPYLYMPSEPMRVPTTNYWLRRLADGDIVLVEEKTPKAPKKEG